MKPASPINNAEQIKAYGNNADLADIQKLDDRVVLDLGSENFPLTDKGLKELHKYLVPFIKAANSVESKLDATWGIKEKFKKIHIAVSGPFNVVSASDQINCYVGKPADYPQIFASPAALYAHELGHYLSFFSDKGDFTAPIDSNKKERKDIWRSKLNSAGDLPCKYFHDIPFHFLPANLLFADDTEKRPGLFYFANEFIATKVAMQVSGREEVKKFVRGMIELEHGKRNPYELMYMLVLADKLGLHQYEGVMMAKVKEQESEWSGTISTKDLMNAMSQFFDSVSLKDQ